jgi:hypothetical protein
MPSAENDAPTVTSWHLPAWHGCMAHNHNHCPECQSCSHWES